MLEINIGILTSPLSLKGLVPLSNLIDILSIISTDLYLITGSKGHNFCKKNKMVHTYEIYSSNKCNLLSKALNHLRNQIRISYIILTKSNRVNIWVFFIGAEVFLLPMLACKLSGKRVVLCLAGSPLKICEIQKNPFLTVIKLLSNYNLALSDRIVVYSKNIINDRNLFKFSKKIRISPRHFLDFERFKIVKNIQERGNIVGYVGALSEIKGIMNLLQAIPLVLEREPDTRFVIIGEGPLFDQIKSFIYIHNIEHNVELTGWVPHDNLFLYLNEFKFIVLPSFTEGLPNIILEAMACGTPVLTTSVGSISDLIVNNENGFLLRDYSADCISKNIIKLLNSNSLFKVSIEGRSFVENNFTFEIAAKNYREIIHELNKN